MKNKYFIAVIFLMLTVLMTGCSDERSVADAPLSEDEVIAYAQAKIYEETGDRVKAEIVAKNQLKRTTLWFDGPVAYQNVENGSEYELKITSKDNEDIVARAYYKDGYTVYDEDSGPGGYKQEPYFSHDYVSRRGFNTVKTEFIRALDERFDEYYIYDDVSTDDGLDIFICSSDYEVINDLLLDFKNTVIIYRDEEYVTYSVYIYKDEQAFNNKDFERYEDGHEDFGGQSYGEDMISQYTGKQVVKLSNCEHFDQDFFESDGAVNAYRIIDDADPDSFDYLIFYYDAEPNAFVGANTPFTTVYGVR